MPRLQAQRLAFLCFGLWWAFVSPLWAQLPVSRLASVFPPSLTIGATNEITVTGEYLDEPTGLLFSDARIAATPKPGSGNIFLVVVPTNNAPKYLDARFIGRFGVSNPRAMILSTVPDLLAPVSNTTLTNAFDVSLDRTIAGRVAVATDHWFHFAARQGQRFLARVASGPIDSRLEPVLVLYSSDGRELAQGQRVVIDYTPAADGHFALKLRDGTYRGGDEYIYRLELSTAPHFEFAVPFAVQSGVTNRAMVFGRNLPGSQRSAVRGIDGHPLEQIEVETGGPVASAEGIPIEAVSRPLAFGGDAVAWRFNAMNALSDSILLGLAAGPVVGTVTSTVTPVILPCEYGGLFPGRRETSGVRFEAKKDSAWRLELVSDRFGYPTAPGLMLQRSRKDDRASETYTDVEEIKDAARHFDDRDFNTATRDISTTMRIPEDGNYRLIARDYFHLGDNGPHFPYWLRILPDAPDLWVGAIIAGPPKAADADRKLYVSTACLHPGETIAVRVYAIRHQWEGDIEIWATNLPPGVVSLPSQIASGQHTGILLLTAKEGAIGTQGAIQILARATAGKTELVRIARPVTVVHPVANYEEEPVITRLMRELVVSVASSEIAPITIAANAQGPIEVLAGGQVKVPLRVAKRLDFTGNFKLKPSGHPGLDKSKELEINLAATNAVLELNLGETSLPEGVHTLWLQGNATVKYRSFVEGAAAAEAELATLTKAVGDATKPEDKKAAEEKVKAATERKKAADERAKPRDIPVIIYTEPFVLKVNPAPKTPAKT